MKIVVTGSLGHIGKPLTQILTENSYTVTVISSNPGRKASIEALGATAAIGSVNDIDFLTAAFTGADAVYCMVPPDFKQQDQIAYYINTGNNYAKAIQQSGVKHAILLSSYGAHLEKGTGFITGSHKMEKIFNDLNNVALTHIRAGYFYYNLFGFINMIKTAGFIGANYGGDDKLALVAPADIAAVIAASIKTRESGIRYAASDEKTCNEIAGILGDAIGKPDLEWKVLTSEQMQQGLEKNGLPAPIAANLVELGAAIHSGDMLGDYELHKPLLGKIKIEDFASEFAHVYHKN